MKPGTDRRPFFVLFAAIGLFSQVAQALLIRELLVIFYGNEISIGAFYGGWLFWIAIGGWCGVLLERRRPFAEPLLWIVIGTFSLPPLLGLEIGAARVVRHFIDLPAGQFIPLGHLLLATFLLTLPVGWLLGFLFPIACKGVSARDTTPVTTLYVLEALGALAGGALFTFVLIEWLGTRGSLAVATVVPVLAILAFPTVHHRWPRLRGVGLILILLAVGLLSSPIGQRLEAAMERLRFHGLHPQLRLKESLETRYGHVALADLGEQTSVVVDGRITASFPASREIALESAFYYLQGRRPRRVLLFGGVLAGVSRELLRYPLERLDVVVTDRTAFDAIRPHLPVAVRQSLEDPRITLHYGDGRTFANHLTGRQRYDLVLVRLSDPASARHNRFFTRDFYQTLHDNLSDDGVLCTGVGAASNYLGRDVQSYSGSVFHTLGTVLPERVVVPGERHLFCASARPGGISADPEVLEHRYRALDQHGERLPTGIFQTLIPPKRAAFVRQRLAAERGEINTDLQPVTFYLNMVLWGKFTASGMGTFLAVLKRMGIWPYLLPLAVYVTIWLVSGITPGRDPQGFNRGSALLALAVLGFVAMAAQLMTLFAYQARVGFIFSRIALLNGLFMCGLALGAALFGRRLAATARVARWLALDLLAVALYGVLFPVVLSLMAGMTGWLVEGVFFSLSGLIGLLAGIGFPLAVTLTHGRNHSIATTGGLAEAGDHLGGALGGLVTGGLLVPLLGITGTGRLLALAAILALTPLLLVDRVPFRIGFLHRRGRPSFPHAGPTALAWFAVLTGLSLGWLAREADPGARVTFERATLAAVSGSNRFEFKETPHPHYLGSENPGQAAETVSLASAPVTAVRGYAGPLNILVAVDRQGVLRGAELIHSHETPAYIHDLPAWLSRLKGHDFFTAPLALNELDAVSGATVSSRAALETINRTAAVALENAFAIRLPRPSDATGEHEFRTVETGTILLLLTLFPFVYLRNRQRERLLFMAASLLFIGFVFNALLTEVDLANAGLGRFPSWSVNPVWWLLGIFAVVITLSWGQAWCGFVCPFGALQEFISRLADRRGWLLRADRRWETRGRHGKYLLLALTLTTVGLTENLHWLSFNPMQGFFAFNLKPWMLATALLALGGSMLFFRYWCRYWCPLGAFLALGNKLNLFANWQPKRHFNRCDLGVGHGHDVDCLRCNRCEKELGEGSGTRQNTPLFLLLGLLTALTIAGHLWTDRQAETETLGGWRRVDIEMIERQIGSGRLSDREGRWYRKVGEGE